MPRAGPKGTTGLRSMPSQGELCATSQNRLLQARRVNCETEHRIMVSDNNDPPRPGKRVAVVTAPSIKNCTGAFPSGKNKGSGSLLKLGETKGEKIPDPFI